MDKLNEKYYGKEEMHHNQHKTSADISSLYFQILMSARFLLIIVITMQHVSIRMDHLLVRVILDTLVMELHVKVLA